MLKMPWRIAYCTSISQVCYRAQIRREGKRGRQRDGREDGERGSAVDREVGGKRGSIPCRQSFFREQSENREIVRRREEQGGEKRKS